MAIPLASRGRNLTYNEEGAFYVWTRKEFDVILGEQDASICARYWNVHRDGNVDPAHDPHDEFIAQVGPATWQMYK